MKGRDLTLVKFFHIEVKYFGVAVWVDRNFSFPSLTQVSGKWRAL
jgi:hypothetical protein